MSKPSKSPRKVEAAAAELLQAVREGQEFPDASARIAMVRWVDIDALRAAYDALTGDE